MKQMIRSALSLALISLGAVACAGAEEPTSDSPVLADDDALDTRDQGTTYNGWTQTVFGSYSNDTYPWTNWWDWGITFTRSSGDLTRGGGACVVFKKLSSTCTQDSTCDAAAKAAFGSDGYGYCYSGACYHRAGSQANYCTLNANRAPDTYYGQNGMDVMYGTGWAGLPSVLGCMTKTAGPNTACGGTNGALYMRTISAMTYGGM